MITQVSEPLYKQLIRAYDEEVAVHAANSLGELRKLAFERFKQVGFPTVKSEDWKYTNVQPLVNQTYSLSASEQPVVDLDLAGATVPDLDAYRIILVDGAYDEALSSSAVTDALTVLPIEKATEDLAFAKHFAEYADKTDNPFVPLNTALFKSGVFVSLKKDAVLDKPVHIIHVSASEAPLFAQTRNLFVVGRYAEMEVVESLITKDGAAHNLNNHVSEIVVQEGGKLQHYYLQTAGAASNYLNHTEIYQEKHSLYNHYNCTFPGASFVRNNINVRLDDSEVESHLYGITLTAGDQFVDNHTIVD